jgi:hypothetical protein
VTMSNIYRPATLVWCLFSALMSGHSQAQVFPGGNGISLSGVKRFDVYVDITDWAGLSADRQEFRLNTQRIFEAGLEAVGAPRLVSALDYLICRVQATIAGDLVAYTTTTQYWEINSTDVHTLLWQHGGIAAVEADEFDEELVGSECVTFFAEEWQKWNPQSADTFFPLSAVVE